MGPAVNFCRRIRQARASLENAEASFKANREVRGELDLMLAEAELQNLRKKQPGRVAWSRRTLAFSCAVLILLSGFGGWWWASVSLAEKHPPQITKAAPVIEAPVGSTADSAPAKVPEAEVTVRAEAPAETYSPAPEPLAEPAYQPPAAVTTEITEGPMAPTVKKYQQPEPGIRLSSSEMHSLVRKGRQELGNSK